MNNNFNKEDFRFNKAKQEGFLARSAFKLEEIDQKFNIFDKNTKNILDIWCAPWSWIQYTFKKLHDILKLKNFQIIGFDLKYCNLNLENVYTYKQDITILNEVEKILQNHKISKFDVIISDMAPDTIGSNQADAIRSIWLIEETIPIYQKYLKENWKFVIKVFMWPGFEDLYNFLKNKFWWPKKVKIFKPKACRKKSKETYIVCK